ncbi:MAG: phage integrase SAM-like domain-containing protein, partial [Nitrososphaerales archaeon]
MQAQYSRQDFLEKVFRKAHSDRSVETNKSALNVFEKFCNSTEGYSRSSNVLIDQIKLKEIDPYKVLDDFVKYLDRRISANSIRTYLGVIKS